MHYQRNLVPNEFNETDEKQIYPKPKEYIVEFILFNYHNVQLAANILRTYALSRRHVFSDVLTWWLH